MPNTTNQATNVTNQVTNFLKRFHEYDHIDEVFTCGCCFWAAFMLCKRFEDLGAELVYDEIANHFGTRISNRIFDITGDVTDKYNWKLWNDICDELLKQRIVRDCINF